MRYKITTPSADYSGPIGTVTFVKGVGVADEEADAATLRYAEQAGYSIEEATEASPDRLAELEAENEQLKARVAELETTKPPAKATKAAAAKASEGSNA